MQVNFKKKYKNNLFINTNDKAIVLFLGLTLWVFIPILGIFPLLFFAHLNRKQNSQLNLLVILIVILTITIFASSLNIISDLAVYINNYEKLATKNPFEISGSQGFEFILWLVSYPIYIISDGSRYAFIFFWFFVFNLLTFLVITKGVSPRNYGLLSLFIVSNLNFIVYQGFLVRQYLATLIFFIAVINMRNKSLMWSLYLISLFTHIANIIYLPIFLLYNKTQIIQNKIFKISILTLGIILPFSNDILINLTSRIVSYLPSQYASIILAKISFYSANRTNEGDLSAVFIEQFIIFVLILFFLKNRNNKACKEKFIHLLYPILLFLMFVGRDISMFSNRFAFILFPFSGLFYYFLIEYKWKILKKDFFIFVLLIVKILYFSYALYNIELGNNPFNYLDGQVFNSSIFDYIEVVHDGFTNDVKIKDLPNRIFN